MAKTQESNKNKEMYECILRLKDLDRVLNSFDFLIYPSRSHKA